MLQTSIVLDGTLFSECEIMGKNRDGMMRLAEEITPRLLAKSNFDISFASTVNIEKYDSALKRFVAENYPNYSDKIFSKNPSSITNKLLWKRLFRREPIKSFVDTWYKEINEQDIFHSFYYPFPNKILKQKIKKTITYLDIIPLKMDGSAPLVVQRTKDVVKSIENNYAISISEFSRQDLLNYNKKINPEQVFVAPLAASNKLFYQNKNEEDWLRIKNKYGFPDKYFLCVSANEHRKNIPHIIKCFNQFLLQEKYNDIYLVITGNTTHSNTMLDQLDLNPSVRNKIFLPKTFIDSEDLAVVYSNAFCFFFMSLYEGFGLPALEAMQCGAPTVASNTTSLPEVVGDGGILVSPTDEELLHQ